MFNHPRAADAGTVTSIAAAGTTWVLHWLDVANTVVQIVAGIVAIVAGVASAWYYIKSNRRLNQQPKDYGPED